MSLLCDQSWMILIPRLSIPGHRVQTILTNVAQQTPPQEEVAGKFSKENLACDSILYQPVKLCSLQTLFVACGESTDNAVTQMTSHLSRS